MASLQQDATFYDFNPEEIADTADEEFMAYPLPASPSLPAILLTAAFAIACAAVSLYIAHWPLGYDLRASSVLAVWVLCVTFGPLGFVCSQWVGSPTIGRNIGLGCGLTLVTLLFFGLCGLMGALAALVAGALGQR